LPPPAIASPGARQDHSALGSGPTGRTKSATGNFGMSVALEKSVAAEEQEAAVERGSRRSGGREARRAMRAAPLADDVRPIRPGLEGGRYAPLDQNDVERIHEAVLTLLETVGFANAIPSCIEVMTKAGATLGEDRSEERRVGK